MSGCRIAVAMSGGIDSSVAAAILQEQGCDVVGVTLRMWPPEREWEVDTADLSKNEQDARLVASKLGIPHYVLDVREEFSRCVVERFVEEYKAGHTPNPCVVCNPGIKFGVLLDYAQEQFGAEKLATGHYARIEWDDYRAKWKLLRGTDPNKDQGYVIYRLTQQDLGKICFPLGYHAKDEVRLRASELGIDVSEKSESQDICFIPEGKYQDFLRQYAPDAVRPGLITDMQGNTLGEHEGVAFYTVGQRRGLRIASGKRLYVVGIDVQANRVIVGDETDLRHTCVILKDVTLISGDKLSQSVVVTAKIRYNTQDSKAVLSPMPGDWARLDFDEEQRAITPGQSAVFYQGEEVLGGGIIADMLERDWALSRC